MTLWTSGCQAPLSMEFSRQDYTEDLYKKGLNDPDNHNGVVTHLEPDILQCDVKGLYEVLLQTKLVEVMEFQLSSFKTYKMML